MIFPRCALSNEDPRQRIRLTGVIGGADNDHSFRRLRSPPPSPITIARPIAFPSVSTFSPASANFIQDEMVAYATNGKLNVCAAHDISDITYVERASLAFEIAYATEGSEQGGAPLSFTCVARRLIARDLTLAWKRDQLMSHWARGEASHASGLLTSVSNIRRDATCPA